MTSKEHWERIYREQSVQDLSWHQAHADRSLHLIAASGAARDAAIIDVGGGASSLAADLLARGYTNLWVLDVSATALAAARHAMGAAAAQVTWVEADACTAAVPANHFAVWHDRAVFHFLIDPAQRAAYVARALAAVSPGGHLIIATFAEDGPERCSGLPVVRYRPQQIEAQFAGACELSAVEREKHRTPGGATQSFVYCLLRRNGPE